MEAQSDMPEEARQEMAADSQTFPSPQQPKEEISFLNQ